ncbi:putative ABC transporter substrate-binding protein [Gordonia hirsuta DSM 44140 = NBRC 16056]|uniref:Putative ABC transporter substrate-binding protein n=1 Tax=Gordonia hirsuta DSM 44140 = NBRC 16056 TaxID=1121927 RepID=L7L7F1_9ACTN|nr:ABC transporter substrate-binding protein [Gordonia hirsuta]GAC57070.1 putative ABC transporter substrate-binding protein [Gordonia hirsuta DSM 44140 = NBRC 16056]
MSRPTVRSITLPALLAALILVLTACSSSSGTGASGDTLTVQATNGQIQVPRNPTRVVLLDNTAAETVQAMGVTPVAVPKGLLAKSKFADWIDDPDIADVGSHNEPKMEVIEDADPDLIIAGYRFAKYTDDLTKITDQTGGATLDIAASDDAPGGRQEALLRQTTTLGEIFGKQQQAEQINATFTKQLDAAKAASHGQTVFLSIVSGGKIDNGAKRLGPFVAPLDLKDVFAGKAGDHHQNSGLTPEAIAQANPQWVIVMDRDAAVTSGGDRPTPAASVFAAQEAFAGTEFMRNDHVIYLDPEFYVREGIQSYGQSYQQIADALGDAA